MISIYNARMIRLLLLLTILLPAMARAALDIEIVGGAAQQIPIAVVPFAQSAALPESVSTVIGADLRRSGLFRLLETRGVATLPHELSEVKYPEWAALQAQALVIGKVEPSTGGRLKVSFRLLDVLKQNQLAGLEYDITPAQWDQVIAAVKAKGLTPFLDMAYQGFGYGIAEDGAVIQKFVAAGLNFFVSTSFSKSFSLYGERVGGLSVLCKDKEEAGRVLSQLKIVIRTNYSNPPTHGGAVVAAVLASPELRQQWEDELAGMRERIRAMRNSLVDKLTAAGATGFDFIKVQRGMFSYTGLTAEQVERLRAEFGIYAVTTGRICVAALNTRNIDYVAKAIAAVLKK